MRDHAKIASGNSVVFESGGEFRAIDVHSGADLWKRHLDSSGSLSLVGDIVYAVQSDPASVKAVNSRDGSVLFDYPVETDGLIYPAPVAVAESWLVIEAKAGREVILLALN